MNILQDKVAVVTGGSSGIGYKTAQLLAREGAKVVIADVNVFGGRNVVKSILEAGGEALFIKTDVSEPRQCETLVRETLKRFGRLDVACNNAGIGGDLNPLADFSLNAWNKVIGTNLSGVFYCMKFEIPAMLEVGGGCIVNMAAILGRVGLAAAAGYTASKHGVIGLTQTAAVEYATRGIRVNAVGPAFIRTSMIAEVEKDPAAREELIARHPIGRFGEPEEVAELVLWLSSPQSSFVTGAYYPVDGGYLAL